MADVFISYASEDRNRVRPLADALQGRGFSIWWDRALAAGQDYSSIIEKELRDAKAVVVVWTAGSAASTFVRDEAGRARDEGRLVPVILDPVQIPLGFGAFQAEDFTKWNGQRNAAQVQLLEESIKAKLEGRNVDGAAIARKRRKLMSRIRIVSLLSVVALIVVIAVGAQQFLRPQGATQTDLRAHLLQLLDEGKLTPEQAIELAQLLQTDTLGATTQLAEGSPSPAPSAESGAAPSQSARAGDDEVSGLVTEADFLRDSDETYDAAFATLLRHPDPQVRTAALQMSQDATRDAATQSLWAYAQSHADDPVREQIYLVCGVVGERHDNPLGQRALEIATNLAPDNSRVWRMLSHSYGRTQNNDAARAAALVGEGVDAQAQGQTDIAEQRLQEALPNLSANAPRAIVASSLGAIAEQRQDWSAASARFSEAYRLRERAAAENPSAPVSPRLQDDAQRLVVALDRSGRTQEACQRLQQAQEAHDVNAPDQSLLDRCQSRFHTRLRPGVLAPRVQRAPTQTTVTTTTTTTSP